MKAAKSKISGFSDVRILILSFVALAVLMFSSALIELSQSKKELLQLMEEQAHSLLETLIIASQNTLYTHSFITKLADESGSDLKLNSEEYLHLRQHIGFGGLLRRVVAQNPRIVFAALQDSSAILSASGNVRFLQDISSSDFLKKALDDSLYSTRISTFDSLQIFEAVHPFVFEGKKFGLFRIGLSLEPMQTINQRIYRRLIIISIILILVGLIMFFFIFTRQRLSLLQKQYRQIETYSSNIISHASDAIIVYNKKNGITIFNSAAENLFARKQDEILGKHLEDIFTDELCTSVLKEPFHLRPFSCTLSGSFKHILISKSRFTDTEGTRESLVLVIRDLTEQKILERQLQRTERLTAMGELASGVAHEIRNPLNTIGTIIQQLDKDFEPAREADEYHELAGLVYGEVKRINDTVQDFLRFSRPEPIQTHKIRLADFFHQIQKQFQADMEQRQIRFKLLLNWEGSVYWDERQIRQVLINLLQNAMEAVDEGSLITLEVVAIKETELEITVGDNGPGMAEEVKENIFNLYYTTKARGTGIGLSIVQRIIFEHDGIINVQSAPGQGAFFHIRLPIHFSSK